MHRVVAVLLVVAGCGSLSRDGSRAGEGTPEAPAPAPAPAFAADSAWTYLTRQVAFGPRVPGTGPHRACGEWLAERLAAAGGRVERDPFTYTDSEGTVWPLVNILGRFGPDGGGRLLLVAHWDTRPWADEDPDPERRNTPIPGAGDGASGVAILLEIARHLGTQTLPRGVDILFVDGEDLGRPGEPEGFCRGSRRFARRDLTPYRRGVVLDLVGDADLHLPIEGNSMEGAPEVVDWVWSRGIRLAPDVFDPSPGPYVFDDHVPLLEAGLPAANIIDFDYAAWHTMADDLPAVSARSLGRVGTVVLSLALEP
jgi:hypothetical protein